MVIRNQKIGALFIFWIAATGCATKFTLTKKRITQNHKFYESLSIQKLIVTKTDEAGFPAGYTVTEKYIAYNLWEIDVKDIAALLPEQARQQFIPIQQRIDSFDRLNVLEDRPADTIRMPSGVVIYTMPGQKRPVEYYRLQNEKENLKYSIKRKLRKTIRFSKPNKWYRWYIPGKGIDKSNIVKFEPGQWYKTSFHCVYGLLADGYCTVYFSFNERGKLKMKRKDYVKDGPF